MSADGNPKLLARSSWHGRQIFISDPVPGSNEKSDHVVTDSRSKQADATPTSYNHIEEHLRGQVVTVVGYQRAANME